MFAKMWHKEQATETSKEEAISLEEEIGVSVTEEVAFERREMPETG